MKTSKSRIYLKQMGVFLSQRPAGATLLWAIGALVVLGALGVGVGLMNPSATMQMVQNNPKEQAYLYALSGVNYAKGLDATTVAGLAGSTRTYLLLNNDGFRLDIGASSSSTSTTITYPVQSIGIVNTSTGLESNYLVSKDIQYQLSSSSDDGDYKGIHIFTKGVLALGNNAVFDGSVMGKDLTINDSSNIGGDVISSTYINVVSHTTIGGLLCANGDITTSSQSTFKGDIKSQGNVSIGSSSTVVDKSIYAKGSVTIGSSVRVKGDIHADGDVKLVSASYVEGSIYTNGKLSLGSGSRISKNAYVKKATSLESASFIDGNLYSGGNISVGWGSKVGGVTCSGGVVSGDTRYISLCSAYNSSYLIAPTLPVECNILSAPKHADPSNFPSSGVAKSVSNGTLALDPGTYGDLSLGWLGVLKLKTGVYHFKSMDMTGSEAKLYLNVSGGDVTIFVTNYVKMGNLFTVYISNDGSTYKTYSTIDKASDDILIGAKSYLETMGYVTFGNENSWVGTIYAKNNINFGNKTRVIGAVFSSDGVVGPTNNVVSYYVESNYAHDHWVSE